MAWLIEIHDCGSIVEPMNSNKMMFSDITYHPMSAP